MLNLWLRPTCSIMSPPDAIQWRQGLAICDSSTLLMPDFNLIQLQIREIELSLPWLNEKMYVAQTAALRCGPSEGKERVIQCNVMGQFFTRTQLKVGSM